MTRVVICIAAGLLMANAASLAQVTESQTTINRKKQSAMTIEVNAPAKEVQKAWAESFTQNNMKGKSSRGVYGYQNVVMPTWGTDTFNVYTRVESLGPQRSRLYLAAADREGNFITTSGDSATSNKMSAYLYDFVSQQSYSSPDLDIRNYSDSVSMDETASQKYAADKKALEDQRTKLATQIAELDRKYQQDRTGWQTRKQRLDELKRNKEGQGQAQGDQKQPQKDPKQDPKQ